MKALAACAALLFLLCLNAAAESFRIPSYYSYDDFLLAPPDVFKSGLNGYVNPASLSCVEKPDLQFDWSDATLSAPAGVSPNGNVPGGSGAWNNFNRWGLFTALPGFGVGAVHERSTIGSVTDYRVSAGGGNGGVNFGASYGWSSGDTGVYNRTDIFTAGTLIRPDRHVSFGLTGNISTEYLETQTIADLGVRPFGNEKLTLFADYATQNADSLRQDQWSAGAVIEPLPGIRLFARYFESDNFSAGVQVSFGHTRLAAQAHYDKEQNHKYNTYGIDIGGYDRNIFAQNNKVAPLDLHGGLNYQPRHLWDNTKTLMDVLEYIETAKNNPAVSGLSINLSGAQVNPEMLWEIREKLKEFKAAGKKVVIYMDFASVPDYYFASVADRVVINQMGEIDLKGVAFGKFYLKDTLDKLGIGFEEIRLFKYKSAAEMFSRTDMSDADREQNTHIVDAWYSGLKDEVSKARGIKPEAFDSMVNDGVYFNSEQALKNKLVDEVGQMGSTNTIAGVFGPCAKLVGPDYVLKTRLPKDNKWGMEPTIAVVYAIGATSMDSGINARRLVKDLACVETNPDVCAVVLRVDSPGGDALASDLVAEAIKKCRLKKPVIISQGYLAASGGYWISMDGDTILTTPLTLTGSIGVISGWVYNKGLKEKLGITTDIVKDGKYADLGFGMPIPFVGHLPDRNLAERELTLMKEGVGSIYKIFVNKVAEARKKKYDYIDSIAQGRVWTGTDAIGNGLADKIGGLDAAIKVAKEKCHIPQGQRVYIDEYPKPALVTIGMFFGASDEASARESEFVNYMKLRLEYNGKPIPLMPAEYMEFKD